MWQTTSARSPRPGSVSRDRIRTELLRIISDTGGATRAELVRASGLSRSAVDLAVARLIGDGALRETEAEAKGPGSGSGRPGTRLVLNGGPVAGIDFGHNHVHVAIAGVDGHLIGDCRVEVDVDMAALEAMDTAAELLRELCHQHHVERFRTVVAGIPGPVDGRTGVVRSPTILLGWTGISPAKELKHRLGTTVHVENDAALGALGELHQGAGRTHRSFFYIKASHGVGAGLVLNGELFRGGTGLAGEIGHTPLAGRSELCRCGSRGCLEAVMCVEAIRQQILHTHPAQDPDDVRIADDDDVSRRILEDAGRLLGRAVSDQCNLMNPSAVIVGGQLGAASRSFVDGVADAIRRHAQPATADAITVSAAANGTEAELRGAIELARRLPVERALRS